jgi:cyclopropane fatty-acyl-phospholipid synthase-like methyltransferase
MNTKLTTEEFWDHFWEGVKLPVKPDLTFKNDRVISNALLKYVKTQSSGKKSLEIGCAPGKWMVFAAEHLGYHSSGVEYLPKAAETTRKNLIQCNVDGEVITADFFEYKPERKFDLVMSYGFIEHFDNYEDVFRRHLDLVNDNGFLVLGLPRFRGLNYLVQSLIDPSMERPYLRSHVLPLMELKPFAKLAEKYKLKKIAIDYIGGFEPSLFPIGEIKNPVVKFITRVIVKLSSLLFGKINSRYTSSYQIIILQKSFQEKL